MRFHLRTSSRPPPHILPTRAAWIALAALTASCEQGSSRTAAASSAAAAPERAEPAPPPAAKPAGAWAQIAALRKGGKTQVHYEPPDESEAARYGEWVAQATRAAQAGESPPAAPDGFALEAYAGGPLWLLHEQPARRRGAGAVLLRVGAAKPLIVEAPHTFFDEGTLPLARHAFEHLQARALLINTAHRGNLAKAESKEALEEASRGGALPSDVAHAKQSFFQRAHQAACGATADAQVVQLHGFRDHFVPADAVVSAAGGPLDVGPLVARMRKLLPKSGIAEYGRDTRRLGGITNVQARESRIEGVPFLHLELSHSLRTRLRKDAALRNEVLDALLASLQG